MSRIFDGFGALFRWVLQPLLVVALLVFGFLGAMGLSSSREAPARQEQERYAPLVRVTRVRQASLPVTVSGNGTLQPRTRVELVPQVGGRIVEMHPRLRAGGRFAAGEVLARIEAIDYELALATARAEVSAAATELDLQRAEAASSNYEWERLHPGEPVPPLVARDPQIGAAEARLEAAEAQLESARLDLARTSLALPFDGRVIAASIDVGQVVRADQTIGSVYATDVFEVPVPLEVDELAWIRLPDDEGRGGSAARVRVPLGERELELEGRVVRLQGTLDATSRLSRVVVEVRADELEPDDAARLLPGMFVDVELDGGELDEVVALPREAVREQGVVWTVVDGRLRFARPRVRRATDAALLVSGLGDGALVVTSNLEVVTDGMEVRMVDEQGEAR